MIYDSVSTTDEIQQGDIFFDLPNAEVDITSLTLTRVSENGEDVPTTWAEVQNGTIVKSNSSLVKTMGIVASQDCDNLRNPLISFFEIGTLRIVSGKAISPNMDKKLRLLFDGPAVVGYKWFYLPTGGCVNFHEKMAVDFGSIFQVPRNSLANLIESSRKGRLNETAIKHYRVSMANYFTRYAFNKWYSLTNEEYDHYISGFSPAEKARTRPYPGQE